MRYTFRTLFVLIILLVVAIGIVVTAARFIRPSLVYEVNATFNELPTDDNRFENWLQNQPGVARVIVHRDGKTLKVTWIMSRDLLGNPPVTNLKGAFEELGYKSLQRYEEQ